MPAAINLDLEAMDKAEAGKQAIAEFKEAEKVGEKVSLMRLI